MSRMPSFANASELTAALKCEATRAGFDLAGACPAATPPGIDRFRSGSPPAMRAKCSIFQIARRPTRTRATFFPAPRACCCWPSTTARPNRRRPPTAKDACRAMLGEPITTT